MKRLHRALLKINDKYVFLVSLSIVSIFILLPILQIGYRALVVDSDFYNVLLSSRLLYEGVWNTIELIIKVGFMSTVIGYSLAYIMTFYKVRFRKIINILLIVPLAIPVYVAAYTYTNIYFTFPFLETFFRSDFFMNGAVFIYAMFLYPYVYIASKAYLSKNLTTYLEASQTLHQSPIYTFFKVTLPLSRPVIIGSVLFVIFETLSDFAVVEYYGVLTLSRYINIAWFNQGEIETAARFAVYVLLLMYVFISVEKFSRRHKRYTDPTNTLQQITKRTFSIFGAIFSYSLLLLTILLSSVLPLYRMIQSVIVKWDYVERLNVLDIVGNTLWITSISIILILVIGILITTIFYTLRHRMKPLLSNIFIMGYSIPSMVLALGIYVLFIRVDQLTFPIVQSLGINKYLFTSTTLLIIIGFFLKFFSIAFSNILSAYHKIDPHIIEVSETLGETKTTTMLRVNIPILKHSLVAISIILFIDMVKDLTLVYSLRPFNFKTLSTEVYRYAGNEMIEVAAFPSLIIVFLCIVLIILLEEGVRYVRTKKRKF